jgi:hypothetical protein
MNRLAAIMFALVMVSAEPAFARVTISNDLGGEIGTYLVKFRALRNSGERVVIAGTCASACTMLLGMIPRSRICVTPQAVLEFHTAWDPSPAGGHVMSPPGNSILWSYYPNDIRRWIERHGGLGSQILYLRGAALTALVPACGSGRTGIRP